MVSMDTLNLECQVNLHVPHSDELKDGYLLNAFKSAQGYIRYSRMK